jgi:hypothetical protein
MLRLILTSLLFTGSVGVFANTNNIELGIKSLSLTVDGVKNDAKIGTIGFQKSLHKYFKVGAWYGFGMDKNTYGKNVDTFRMSVEAQSVMRNEYTSSFSIDHDYGIEIMANVPLSESFSVYMKLAKQTTKWDQRSFSDFVDNAPSDFPVEDFQQGAGECQITGIERLCGVNIMEYNTTGEVSGLASEFGVYWSASDSAYVSVGYRTMSENWGESKAITSRVVFNF